MADQEVSARLIDGAAIAAGIRRRYYSDNNEDAIIMWTERLKDRSVRDHQRQRKDSNRDQDQLPARAGDGAHQVSSAV